MEAVWFCDAVSPDVDNEILEAEGDREPSGEEEMDNVMRSVMDCESDAEVPVDTDGDLANSDCVSVVNSE